MKPVTDPALLAQLNAGSSPVSDPALLAQLNAESPQAFDATDVAKSAAISIPKGFISAAGAAGDMRDATVSGLAWLVEKFGGSPEIVDAARRGASGSSRFPTSQDIQKKAEGYTGEFYRPQSRAGKLAESAGSMLANPLSYIGPGGLLLKAGGAVLSGVGSEAAGQATEGTAYEGPSRLAGALAGGVTAAKTLGPKQLVAAVPTGQELLDIGGQGYKRAAASGLELDPAGVASWAAATKAAPDLGRFTGGPRGTAPKTIGVLDDLQAIPAASPGTRATIATQNIDDIRQNLRDIAGEVQQTAGGAVKSTPDAVAAQRVLKHLEKYTESIPRGHVVAGDAAAYVRETKLANANYAAGSRARDFDARLTKAERATDRQIAGSLDAQIKTKAGQMIDRGADRGLNAAEQAQLSLIERGSLGSNILRQAGRGGAGVMPAIAHGLAAAGTGGASLAYQVPLAAALYGARKGSEAITKGRAEKLVKMLAMRSPEYEQRVANLPQVSGAPNKAALIRALLAAQ